MSGGAFEALRLTDAACSGKVLSRVAQRASGHSRRRRVCPWLTRLASVQARGRLHRACLTRRALEARCALQVGSGTTRRALARVDGATLSRRAANPTRIALSQTTCVREGALLAQDALTRAHTARPGVILPCIAFRARRRSRRRGKRSRRTRHARVVGCRCLCHAGFPRQASHARRPVQVLSRRARRAVERCVCSEERRGVAIGTRRAV